MIQRSDAEILGASLSAGYVGGGYYNPIQEFINIARPLKSLRLVELCEQTPKISIKEKSAPTFIVSSLYYELRLLAGIENTIFGMYDKGKYQFAVLIHSPERLMDFEVQVCSATLRRNGFFAVNRSQANIGLRRIFRLPSLNNTLP